MNDHKNAPEEKEGFSIENSIEVFIFASRWILAIFYIGLVLALFGLGVKFIIQFYDFGTHLIGMGETTTLLNILGLVDMTLLGNLMLIVIFSGYENFVSVIGVAQESPDRPRWMGDVDFAGLKLKLIGSIVALSGIHLLGAFLSIYEKSHAAEHVAEHAPAYSFTDSELGWMIGLHMTFMITGVLFALSEKISEKPAGGHH